VPATHLGFPATVEAVSPARRYGGFSVAVDVPAISIGDIGYFLPQLLYALFDKRFPITAGWPAPKLLHPVCRAAVNQDRQLERTTHEGC